MRLLTLLILSLVLTATSWAGTINSVEFQDPKVNGIQSILVKGDALDTPSIFEMSEGARRIVVDFENTTSNLKTEPWEKGQTRIQGKGAVIQIRQAGKGEAGIRLVLDLASSASMQTFKFKNNTLEIHVNSNAPLPQRAVQLKPRYFKNKIPYPILKPLMTVKPRTPPIIVIDPGHGGKDPGAVGQGGTYEKSVTLTAAKELKSILEKSGRYQVILTRGGDSYVDHDDRIKIARKKNADLFISIHADSAGSSNVRGASVYTLADRAIGRSKKIVNNQNWILDVDLSSQSDSVGDILVDLAQRKTFSQSSTFADELVSELSKTTELVRNSHRRAGYYVLLAPDVPAVLLELGFLSNKQDEKLLKSRKHRKRVLGSVKTAIDDYFDHQNP